MSEPKNFYEILRSKFIDRDIPANDEDWRSMRKMIDDSRKRNKRVMWTSLSLLLLLLGLGSYFFVFDSNSNKTNTVITNQNVQPAVQSAPPSEQKTAASNEVVMAATSANDKKPVANESSANKENQTNRVAPETINEKASVPVNSNNAAKSVVATSVKHHNNVVAPNKNNEVALNTTARHERHNAKISNATTESVNKPKQVASTQTKSVTRKTNPALTSETKVETNTNIEQANAKQVNSSVKESVEHKVETNPSASDEISMSKSMKTREANNSNTQQLQPDNKSDANSVAQKKDSDTNKQTTVANAQMPFKKADSNLKKADSSLSKPLAQNAPLPPLQNKMPNDNGFYIDAGAGFSLGWAYGSTVQGRSVNPYLGLTYKNALGDKWAFKAGVGLSALGDMSSTSFIIKHETYDFEYNSLDTSLTTKWLIYVTVPLQVEFKIGEKNSLGIGGSLSYLLNGWGEVDTYKVTGSTISNEKKYNQFMYVQGYNQWNTSLFLLYRRSLSNRLSVYVEPYFGLSDIKNNSFFGQNTFERDLGIKLLFSYHIF
jgi:hypothetical protein